MIIKEVLKEWSSALKFYENKKVCMIFRKGGIHEKNFTETEDYFGFFPTFEHESNETVKPSFRNIKYLTNQKINYSGVGELNYFGKILKSYDISSTDNLNLLDEFHIWESSYLINRFNFRPKSPLKCYLLDIFKVKLPKKIEYDKEKAKGCTSWFKLNNDVSIHSYEKISDDFQMNKALKVLQSLD